MKKTKLFVAILLTLIAFLWIRNPFIFRSSSSIESAVLSYRGLEICDELTSQCMSDEEDFYMTKEETKNIYNSVRFNFPYYGMVAEYYEVTSYVTFYFTDGKEFRVNPHSTEIIISGSKYVTLMSSKNLRTSINETLELKGH